MSVAFSLRKKVKHALVVDIASGSVGMALITHNHTKSTSPKIHTFARIPIVFTDMNKPEELAQALVNTLQEVGAKISRAMARRHISPRLIDTHVVVHAPWVTVEPVSADRQYQSEMQFTEDFLHSFLIDSFPAFSAADDSSPVAAYLTDITLNGYRVTHPYELNFQHIKASLVFTYMHPLIKETIRDYFVTAMHVDDLFFASFTQAIMLLATYDNDESTSYNIFDGGGFFSQLSVIRDNQLVQKAEIDFGTHDIYTAIAEKMKVTDSVARSNMRMFHEGTLVPTGKRVIRSVLRDELEKLTTAFGDQVASLSREEKMPEDLYLFTDMYMYRALSDVLEKIDFAPFTISGRPFNVRPLMNGAAMQEFYDSSLEKRDDRLLLASLYVDRFRPLIPYGHLLSSLLRHPHA